MSIRVIEDSHDIILTRSEHIRLLGEYERYTRLWAEPHLTFEKWLRIKRDLPPVSEVPPPYVAPRVEGS